MDRFDYVIAGGGLVGLACAIEFSQMGLRGLLFDQGAEPKAPPAIGHAEIVNHQLLNAGSPRVSAINPASIQFLDRLGWRSNYSDAGLSPFSEMLVWDGEGGGDLGFPAEGLIIENDRLRWALHQVVKALVQAGRLVCRWQTGIQDVEDAADGVSLRLTSDEAISAELMVAADGARSKTRDLLGIRTLSWQYNQTAIAGVIATGRPHGQVARQCFTPDGPLAFLPLPEPDQNVIVWSSTKNDERLNLSPSALCAEIEKYAEGALGHVRAVGPLAHFPLQQQQAHRYVGKASVLVGDAAHSIHPLAGQGLNLGFADVKALAAALQKTRLGSKRGLTAALQVYQGQRRPLNLRMMATTELLKRVFDPPSPALRLARNIGLRWLDSQSRLKHALTLAASGHM